VRHRGCLPIGPAAAHIAYLERDGVTVAARMPTCSAPPRTARLHDVVTVEEAPDRTDAGLLLSLRAQTHADLLERQIWLRGDQLDQPLFVLVQRRAAVPGAGLGLDVSGLPPAIHPSDRGRSAEIENARSLACAFAGLDKLNRTHPEILRISLCHRML